MGLKQTFSNPFYALLLLAGLAFSVTACAYGVMTVRALQLNVIDEMPGSGQQLMRWLDAHGFHLMLFELAVLGVFCVLAITTDSYWERRGAARQQEP